VKLMRKSVLFIFSILFFLQISTTVLAQIGSLSGFDLPKTIGFIVGDPNIQQNHPEWLTIPNVVYYLIFPFIAIVAVIYGILTEIRIFRSTNVKFVLAIVMAGMSLPTGAMITTVYVLYTIGAWFAVVAFGLLFIVGTILWAIGRGGQLKNELYDIGNKMSELKRRSLTLDQQFANGKMSQDKYLRDKAKLMAEYRILARKQGLMQEVGEPG
jgi:hypothetical protein